MSRDTDIAIIGMAGQYPKANSPDELWKYIVAAADLSEHTVSTSNGLVGRHLSLTGIDQFDNAFFGLTAYEAQIMDPQHRLLLTCAYRAMENAGYERWPTGVRVGLFASTSISTYLINVILKSKHFDSTDLNYQILLGNDKDALATRIAYKLNLTGPALTIQSACSSSLVAIHCACQSLLTGDSDVAIVGAVSITIPQDGGYYYKEGGILSRDGYCRPFDKDASGTIKGNGCSTIVLRRVVDAERVGDDIAAVIRGTAINNDGADKIGFTAPSVSGQRSVIREALQYAGLTPNDIDYIEAHGTGTDLGDQIELRALADVFSCVTKRIPIGSLKANVGHLDVAAGISSVIKGVKALSHGIVAPIAHLRQPNETIPNISEYFEFPKEARRQRLENISVSSFGIGGTNAHAVISRYEACRHSAQRILSSYLVPVYLNKHEDLAPYAASLTARLKEGASLLDLSATLAERRRRRAIVRCFVVESSQEWAEQLARPVTADDVADVRLPRFTADELASIASELPAMGYSSDDKDTPTSEALAAALARLLDTMGVFAAPDVVAQNEFPANCDGDRISAPQLSAYLVRDTSDADSTAGSPLRRLLQFVARVHTKFELDVSALYAGTGWRSGSLPAYPLTPVRHWIDNEAIPQPGGHAEAAIARKPIHDDQLVEEIVEIWKQGIGDDSVTSETTFVDTGADSLTAIEILDRINRTFGTSIPVSASLARVTPSEIASQMLGRELRSSAPWVSYVRYRSPDAKTVFLVHPAGGSTFCYSALSRHVMKHVNLCAIDLPEGYEGYGSLTDLARRYADVIRTYQPNGPYLVGGYSFGGNLAHELARELESRNCAVEAVVMFDSHPPEAYNAYVGSDFDYVGAFPTLVASYFKPELIDVASREGRGIIRLDAAVDVVRRLGILSDSLKNDDIERFFDRWVFTHRLLKAHEPAAGVAAPLFMFVARDDEPAVLLDKLKIYSVSKDSWKKYFSGPVTSIPVDGDHFTMFGNASHLKALAGKFDTVLHDFAMQRA